ncbi:CHAT domain-containing protein [Streptomyces sp. NPDC002668]|uniref:CHAT domain-containing protein n=1 Tax=Streptomyces sp. NPDC002668 TaxID=3154422 RepID=UPI00331DCCE1
MTDLDAPGRPGPALPGMRGLLDADAGAPPPEPAVRPTAPTIPEDVVPARPAAGFDPERAGLADALPPEVALLCVTSSSSLPGQPALSLNWHHARSTQAAPHDPVSPKLPLTGLSLAALMKEVGAAEGQPWEDAYYDAMNWWLPQDPLVGWIRDLLATTRHPRLIIWDNTAHDIPWELFYHQSQGDAENQAQGWLGELIPVIRWTSIHDGERTWRFSAEECASEGPLLMLEDMTLKEQEDIFKPYLIEDRFETMEALMHRLSEPATPFGLLMIRCHGEYSSASRSFKLGGLALNRYTDYSMAALRTFRPPVVLNACASGRTLQDERYPGKPVRSFAELFLRRGASAVIAVVGDVGLLHSHDFARRLLEMTAAKKTNLATVLQEHRQHYAKDARRPCGPEDPRTEGNFKLFFASFLYVYYGHPNATLRTTPRRDGGAP